MNATRSFALIVVSVLPAGTSCDRSGEGGSGAAAAASVEQAAAPPVTRARFVSRPIREGDAWRTERDSELKLSAEFWGENDLIGRSETRRREVYKAKVRVLAPVGAFAGKIRVFYDRYDFDEAGSNDGPAARADLEGRPFIVDALDKRVSVTGPKGETIDETSAKRVLSHFPKTGQADPIVAALGSQPIELGRTFQLSSGMFRALLGAAAGEFRGGRIATSRASEEGATLFEWTAEMQTSEDNGMLIAWHLKGKTVVENHPARVLSNTISGVLDVSGRTKQDGVWIKIAGSGSMRDERHDRYGASQ